MNNSKLPSESYVISDIIRVFVPRPTLEDIMLDGGNAWIRFGHKKINSRPCCPLGLLPLATVPSPTSCDSAGLEYSQEIDREIAHFLNWWDNQRDAQHAINEVWGPA